MYQLLKKYGFPDDHIIVMLPENHQCHPRNPFPGKIFDGTHAEDLMADVEIDYKSLEITPNSIVGLLTGRHASSFPINKQLNSNKNSKVFVYLTGHGGNGYFKIQDTLVLKSDLSYAVKEMYEKQRFGELFIMLDTCQAFSMFDYIDIEGVHMISSSLIGQPAKSYGFHDDLGLSTTDHFTYFFSEIFRSRSVKNIAKMTVENVIKQLPESTIKSNIGFKSKNKPNEVLVAQFLSFNFTGIHVLDQSGVVEQAKSKIWKVEGFKRRFNGNQAKNLDDPQIFNALLVLFIGWTAFYITSHL